MADAHDVPPPPVPTGWCVPNVAPLGLWQSLQMSAAVLRRMYGVIVVPEANLMVARPMLARGCGVWHDSQMAAFPVPDAVEEAGQFNVPVAALKSPTSSFWDA